ncbi:MAG: hypothetical protein IJ733_07055 [Lachnospiraceae bacterium]|nr:hypothetical protein [Lachnospiraceae bacterium]
MSGMEMDGKIQWHPGFVAAMNLELEENREDLFFEDEYNLNKRPLEIDLLVIKKTAGVKIKNEIGKFFRRHNLLEYKSPEDSLSVDTLYKVLAYAALYKSYGDTVDAISADDITVTLMREGNPEDLFLYLKEHGAEISNPFCGIYYLEEKYLFPVQIVVGKELDAASHVWLRALSAHMQKQEMWNFLETVSRITEQGKREFADSVLEVSARANIELIELLRKEDDGMSEALIEIFAPEIKKIVDMQVKKKVEEQVKERVEKQVEEQVKERVEKQVEEVTDNKRIAQLIITSRKYGATDYEIAIDISAQFQYSEEDAKGKIEEYDAGLIHV